MAYRFQVEIDGEDQIRFDQMKGALRANSNKELFDIAFTVLEWAVETVRDGNHIAEVDRNRQQFTVVKVPALERLRERRLSHTPE